MMRLNRLLKLLVLLPAIVFIVTGIRWPVAPVIGRDLSPALVNPAATIYGPDDAVGYELAGHALLFQGDYKIVFHRGPLGDDQWRLFNIVEDPGETHDLAREQPQQLQTMLSAYQRYVRDNKVLPVPSGFDNYRQLVVNTLYARLRTPILVLLLTLLVLLPFYAAYRTKGASRR